MNLTIFNKSCEDMSDIEDESIACIFTSPPYALAKDYGDTGCIGGDDNLEAYSTYLTRMKQVLIECFRVLQQGRYIGINIADIIQTDSRSREKKPIAFNYMQMLFDIGFEYCDYICWKKPDGMSTQKRFGVLIQNPYPMYYHPNNVYEPILLFKKPGKWFPSDEQKKDNTLNWKELQKFQTDIWEVHPETHVDHPAPFPWKLPLLFFELFVCKGETVLDPFLGSGSSLMAAKQLKMNGIGYEINPKFVELCKKRIQPNQQDLFGEQCKFEVLK